MLRNRYFSFVFLLSLSAAADAQINPTVRFHTNIGDIDVVLTPDTAPKTVANFLNYLSKGAYTNSIFHRDVPGFVIQGGGFQLIDHNVTAVAEDPPVVNEFNVTNARGTIAMAKLGTDPNSATSQWFFNLANNASQLDGQNGGFTVFGHVANAAGLTIMDRIAAFPQTDLSGAGGVYSAFTNTPLNNYKGGPLQDGNFVLVSQMYLLPVITAPGVASAATFGATNLAGGISPGEILTIFGTSLGPSQLTTLTLDSNGVTTNSLAGTRVLFGNPATPAPIIYTSANQISFVVPYNVAGKATVQVSVESQGIASNILQFPVVAANPGIFTLNSSGKGDAVIIRLDASIVSAASPAQPGETLILYGEGYGAVTPETAVPDGTIISTKLPVPLTKPVLLIDGVPVETLYAGSAGGLINGVMQINFKVPALNPGNHQIQVQVGDRTSPSGVTLQTK